MSVEKWWNEICGRGKREKPREKPIQIPFRPPRNPHGVTETRTRDTSGGRRAPNRLRHEAALLEHIQQVFELFSNIFTYRIETFVIPWDQLLYPCVVEVCRLGLEPL